MAAFCNEGGKMVISVKKVFDAGIKQMVKEQYRLSLNELSLSEAQAPLTFVRAVNALTVGEMSGVSIERITGSKKARIRCTIAVPLRVEFVDANGVEGYGQGDVVLSQDVVMSVPEPSIIPYSLEAITSASSTKGEYIAGWEFSLDVMITLILKIVIDADIVVPTGGYAEFSPIQNYENTSNTYFDLPLYPNGKKV